ncbi:MAG: bifunctional DNA-formamidopyrimidine glycosylase/DNA-(apurinic or apyrimidinic site) lyase [Anaerolineae bacterium]|nr:bifunctional DNA-formamidopyrimidine glycosylase/DNA-(apurinic or apyrimidinic site) lyase [Anaerolineae bacterium]
MPELPEVETVVRGIRPDLVQRRIEAAWLDWEAGLVTPAPEVFHARIAGQQVQEVTRRAKYIVIQLEADWLLIHLKMTGRLYIVPDEAVYPSDKWVHFRFQLDNAYQLRFSDARKFGRVYLVEDAGAVLDKLGPEPLEETFSCEDFVARLGRRKGMLKPLLLNQTFLAGVGNIYADEALHRAGLHPQRLVSSLSEADAARLYDAIRAVLQHGIVRQGASINWYRDASGEKGSMQDDFLVYDQTGQLCRTCQAALIEKMVLGQRGTHFCPNCQR